MTSAPPDRRVGIETRLLDRVRAAVMVFDLDGTIRYANPFCEELFGRTPGELSGRASADFTTAPLDEATMREIGVAMAAGRSWEGDFRIVRGDGTSVEVHAVNSPLFGETDEVTGVVCLAFDVTRRRLVEQRVTRQEAEQRFLAETNAMLASSLAFPDGFEHLARLSVPFMADLCLVDVADESGLRRVAAVHADPEKDVLARELAERFPPVAGSAHPAASVVRGGRPEFAADMSDEYLRATTRDDEHYEIVRALGFTSYICVPLSARGRVLGALTLVSAGSGRRFTEADLSLAEEYARRAALALDNARLYSERDRVARALQASLLPPSLPQIPGVQLAARYVAAGEGSEVGGDFYDVFQVRRNTWCLLVGDVAGKGPEAASVAGLARHSLRAAAILARRPAQMLRTLHEALRRDEASAGRFCTVCCGLLRRIDAGAELVVSCGGHPLPLVARADGTVESLDCGGMLLGLADPVRLRNRPVRLTAGDVVVMFTDGAIEAHRSSDELFGEERLADLVRRLAPRAADEIADELLRSILAFGPPEPRDDVAILVAKMTTPS